MFEIMDNENQEAVIKVIGVGGCGGNAVEHMIAKKCWRRRVYLREYRHASAEKKPSENRTANWHGYY